MTAAVTKGTFADIKLVRSRKVAQIVVEIPIEQANGALAALGGLPAADSERWVAVALLDLKAAQQAPEAQNDHSDTHAALKASVRMAGILCNEPRFKGFLRETFPKTWMEDPADFVRWHCGVNSRAELATNREAAARWDRLESAYRAWLHKD